METFKEYCSRKDEGLGDMVKGAGRLARKVMDNEYWDLTPQLKNAYNRLDEKGREYLHNLRTVRMLPLAQALQTIIDEQGARAQWQQYNQMVGPERKAYGVKPWGPDSPGWKGYRGS